MAQAHPNVLLIGTDPESLSIQETMTSYVNMARVESVRKALETLRQGTCDLILCEWELPDGNWRTVLKELQKRGLDIPVIVFCHCGGELEWTETLQAGAFDLLAPPYSVTQIMALIEHAVASSHKKKDCCLST